MAFLFRTILTFLFLIAVDHVSAQTKKILVPYRVGNLWGYSDTLGKTVIKPAYDSVGFFRGEFTDVYKKRKHGVVNNTGKLLVAPVYDRILIIDSGFIIISGKKFGFINTAGALVLPMKFDDIYTNGEILEVYKNGKLGLYTFKGKLFLPVVYDKILLDISIPGSKDQYYLVEKEGVEYLVDKKTGKVKKYEKDDSYGELVAVTEGMYEPENIITPVKERQIKNKFNTDEISVLRTYRLYGDGSDNYFLVSKNGKKGVVHHYGDSAKMKLVIPISYDDIAYVQDNFVSSYLPANSNFIFVVKKDGKYGLLNENEKTLLPFEYDLINELAGGMRMFELTKNNKKGIFLPNTSYPLIQPKYESVNFTTEIPVNDRWSFVVCRVMLNGKYGYVGENGVEYFK
jgi:hypothetical protein